MCKGVCFVCGYACVCECIYVCFLSAFKCVRVRARVCVGVLVCMCVLTCVLCGGWWMKLRHYKLREYPFTSIVVIKLQMKCKHKTFFVMSRKSFCQVIGAIFSSLVAFMQSQAIGILYFVGEDAGYAVRFILC